MTSNQPPQGNLPLPRWWTYYATIVSAVAVVGLILGVVGIYTNGRQDAVAAAENKVRDEQNRTLLDCFDAFASDLAGGLPPVRAATAETGEALAAAMTGLQKGLIKVGTNTFEPSDLTRIIHLFDDFQKASEHLTKVRAANPYPAPPSTFCATN